jgi:hypothetical protein
VKTTFLSTLDIQEEVMWLPPCWIAMRFQASEVAWEWTFRRCQFSKILVETE